MNKLILLTFFISLGAHALVLPCPENMIGPENFLKVNLKSGSSSARIEGPAAITFDECQVELTDEAIIPTLKIRVKTDAKFIFKKKILFAKVQKTVPLRCSFKSTVNTKILDACQVRDTKFSFYRLNCRGFPKIFTKLIEKLIKKEIRKKGGDLIQKLLNKASENDEIFGSICGDA